MTNEQKKLVEDNHKLIFSFLKKYKLPEEEFYGLASIGLCKAAIDFEPGISEFSTYAYKCMFNECTHELRRLNLQKTVPEKEIVYYNTAVSTDEQDCVEILDFLKSKENVEKSAMIRFLIEDLMSRLSERDRIIIEMLALGYGTKDIRKAVGCSKQTIYNVRTKAKTMLGGRDL